MLKLKPLKRGFSKRIRFGMAIGAIVALVLSQCSLFIPSSCSTPPRSVFGLPAQAASVPVQRYTWRNVAIGGMGFVTGLVIHPRERDLMYVRTDVGGAYRWNAATTAWIPLMDGFAESKQSYYSIESIALDPNNPNVVYVATGAKTDGTILKSSDRGQSWTPTPLKTPSGKAVRMDGNQEWRWAGERLAVDPNNSRVVYFGSRLDGLYRSRDGATTWQKIVSFPTIGTAPGGITFVVFDPRSKIQVNRQSVSQTIVVGVIGSGVYRSTDGGNTWRLINSPQKPQQAAFSRDGTLYISAFGATESRGEVWKYAGNQSSQITPIANKNYSAIAVDARNPNTVMVAEYPLTPEGIHRSTDGGKSWTTVRLKATPVQWWPDWHLYTLMGRLAIDPHHPNRVWLTNGFGVLKTDNITAQPSAWSACMSNLEELVTFVVKSPPLQDTPLLSGVADLDGFRHTSLTQVPVQTYDRGKFGDTTGIDFAEANPQIVVRVGSSPGGGGREDSQVRAAYSSDRGQTWRAFAQVPAGAVNGKVAVSATLQPNGYPIIVWTPQGDLYPHRSLDGGRTWLSTAGAPNRTILQLWFSSQALASDRVDGKLFYLYKYNERPNQGMFYRSVDGGATWTRTATGLPDSYFHSVKAAPNLRGEVWLSVRSNALYRSSNAGTTFTRLAQIDRASEFAFGKAAPGRTNPTVFVYGVINQTEGLFRSDDATSLPGTAAAAKWIKISDARQALGTVNYLEGDRLNFGRIYVGTGGRGILYGQQSP